MLLDHTAMHVRNPDSIAAVSTLVLYYKQAFELPQLPSTKSLLPLISLFGVRAIQAIAIVASHVTAVAFAFLAH